MRDAQDADVLAGRSPAPAASAPDASSGSSVDLGFLGALRRAIAVAAAVVVVDQLTKWWAIERLSTGPCGNPDGCIELLAGIRLRLVFNTGAAFTAGSGYGPVLAVLAIVMTVVLLTMSARRPDRAGAVLLAVIAGGAVGNLIDRIFRAEDGVFSGAVIDFIDLGWWPVFNLADSAIVVGVAAVVVVAFFDGRSGAGETEGEKVRPSRRPGETVG